MMTKKFNFWKTLPVYTTLLICLMTIIPSACTYLKIEKFTNDSIDRREKELLKTGYHAFIQKDFEKAARMYSSLYKESRNKDIKRRALYGLSCARLITAENVPQHAAAINLWNKWENSVSDDFPSEDPQLLGPYIQMAVPPYQKNTQIQALINENNSLKKEIITLKHQIACLEAIDQKIEEKKKEISAP